MDDLTALSHWFPLVEAAGLPVPRTAIFSLPDDARDVMWAIFDNQNTPTDALDEFVARLREAGEAFTTPFFLRTDYTSGKHEWKSCCFVEEPAKLRENVLSLAYFSELHWMQWDTWVVRELLPTVPVGLCPRFDDMPVCKEFRFFVDGGKIECAHPYWPRHALEQVACELGGEAFAELCEAGADWAELVSLATRAGEAVGGRWSVDLLKTARGWFLTDMAEADKSWHWEGCPAQAMSAREGQDPQGLEAEGPPARSASADAPLTPCNPEYPHVP